MEDIHTPSDELRNFEDELWSRWIDALHRCISNSSAIETKIVANETTVDVTAPIMGHSFSYIILITVRIQWIEDLNIQFEGEFW